VTNQDDDILGEPAGHFVVITGYDQQADAVTIADPYSNPFTPGPYYMVPWNRLASSVLLGVVTYDANLLVLSPSSELSP
jgi:hypothetical protein